MRLPGDFCDRTAHQRTFWSFVQLDRVEIAHNGSNYNETDLTNTPFPVYRRCWSQFVAASRWPIKRICNVD